VQVPTWAPASVGAAAQLGSATAADLVSGGAWSDLCDALLRAGQQIEGAPVADRAEGYRHLLVMLALGIDAALRAPTVTEPRLARGAVDHVLKWGMDCPDALYSGAPVQPGATYRVTGRRATVRYLGFQVMGGMATLANVVADDLDVAHDGSFAWEFTAPDGASALVVRQFFYDWAAEVPAELAIRRLGDDESDEPRADAAQATARQLVALGDFLLAGLQFWGDIEATGRAQGPNCFREPANRTDIGGAEENVTVWGSYDLADDEALLIEVTPPDALYWSVTLGDPWWKSIDYANHQSSLNGHQAVIDGDGAFRAVVCQEDPGMANWLDPAGFRHGPMIVRWLRADAAPVPDARVVGYAELDSAMPAGTARVTPGERSATIAARRDGVLRRFGR